MRLLECALWIHLLYHCTWFSSIVVVFFFHFHLQHSVEIIYNILWTCIQFMTKIYIESLQFWIIYCHVHCSMFCVIRHHFGIIRLARITCWQKVIIVFIQEFLIPFYLTTSLIHTNSKYGNISLLYSLIDSNIVLLFCWSYFPVFFL